VRVVGATSKATEAEPLPFEADRMVTQSALDTAVQVQSWLEATTPIDPDPPACGKLAEGPLNERTHAPASCSISAR